MQIDSIKWAAVVMIFLVMENYGTYIGVAVFIVINNIVVNRVLDTWKFISIALAIFHRLRFEGFTIDATFNSGVCLKENLD